MKLQIIIPLLLLASSALATGGEGTGGGNVDGSPAFILKSAVDDAKNVFAVEMDALLNADPLVPKLRMQNPNVARVFAAWSVNNADGAELTQDIANTRVEFVQGNCVAPSEGSVDASTGHTKSAPICVSLSRLKRIPQTSLKKELSALFAHEFAHHFGFGEIEAQSVQRYFRYNEGLFCAMGEWAGVKKKINLLKAYLSTANSTKNVMAETAYRQLCMNWSNVTGLGLGLGLTISDPEFKTCDTEIHPTPSTLALIDSEASDFERTLMSNEYDY